MRHASIWILAFVLAACSAEDWNWNLPRTNPVDPAVNTGATLPVTLPALITSNSTATLRGRIEPYTPMFNGAVALEWKPVGGEWTRIAANEDATGLFEANLGGLSPGGDCVCRAWMGIGSLDVWGQEYGFTMPSRPRIPVPTPPPATTMPGHLRRRLVRIRPMDLPDSDGDGSAMPMPRRFRMSACPVRLCPQRPDRNDDESSVYPGAPATAMGLDNDCSGVIEEDEEAPPSACWIHHCEDLDGLEGGSNVQPSWACYWDVGPGYSGSGVYCGCAGWMEFDYSESTPFTVRFWMSAYDAGYWTMAVPEVSYNGTVVTSDIITGDPQGGDGTDWLQRESGLIPAGSGTVRIEFSGSGQLYARRIDEIELWCNP